MTDEAESDAFRAAQERQLEAEMQAAVEGVQGAVRRLMHEGSVDPRLILLAMARVMGELAAASALAEGLDAEEMLGEVGELVRQAGREGLDELRAAGLPTAGNA
jgi:hypothetical protein